MHCRHSRNTYAGLYAMLIAATLRMVKILCGLCLGSRDVHKLLLLQPLQLLMIKLIRIMLLILMPC